MSLRRDVFAHRSDAYCRDAVFSSLFIFRSTPVTRAVMVSAPFRCRRDDGDARSPQPPILLCAPRAADLTRQRAAEAILIRGMLLCAFAARYHDILLCAKAARYRTPPRVRALRSMPMRRFR